MILRLIITTLCILGCYNAFTQTANFSYDPPSGLYCTPQTMTFTQTSTGNPTSVIWDFGNGIVGNEFVETIIYDAPGTYTVKLIAIYNNLAVTTSKSITIQETPTITLTANKFTLCMPGSVTFTANGTGSNSWKWDFGDGSPVQTTSTNTITHNFTGFGNFRVIVEGIGASGCSMTAAVNIDIEKFPLTATVTPPSGCIPMVATIQVTATMPPGDSRTNILYEFGDGTPNASNNFATFNHTYNTTNRITAAKVTVTTAQGCTNEFVFPEFGYGTPPTGTNGYTTSGRDTFCGSEIVDFYATANNANYYLWDFGGGVKDSVPSNAIAHKFRTLGTKNVTVTPYFNGCPGPPDDVPVFIHGVIAYFDIENSCGQKNNYFFRNTSLGNISHFEWTFSDEPNSIDSVNLSATHLFPPVGSFNTYLLLIDNTTGCRDSLRENIYTAVPSFTSNTNTVCKDSLMQYTVNASYPQGVGYSYEYHVNGETISNGDTTTLSYNPKTHGVFNDFVVINDGLPGTCSDTLILNGTTRVRGPVAAFDIPEKLCADTAVSMVNNSYPFYNNEPITSWRWNFNDGKQDSVQNPQPHLYRNGGTYGLSLLVTDANGCGNLLEKPVTIHPLPKVNILPNRDTICSGEVRELIAYSIDDITWTPATNISCTSCDTVTIRPTTNTNYVALATSIYSCKKTDTAFIKVYEPFNLTVTPSDTAICPGGTVSYQLNKNGVITWSPPTYLSSTTTMNPVSRPDANVDYKIFVSDSIGCFSDSAIARIKVYPKATVDAGPDLWLDYETPFTISPIYSPGIRSYLWTPSDSLSCRNCATPSGIARSSINYKIQIEDNNGCKAEDEVAIMINCVNSKLYFPSAFTPNRDGLNDYFYPIARGFDELKSFVIFNRNGYKVFERTHMKPNIPSQGWDGRIRGDNTLNTQTFVWFAEVYCEGKIVVHKGTVTLIR